MLLRKLVSIVVLAAEAAAHFGHHKPIPKRPTYAPSPKNSWKPMPYSPPRNPFKTCFVQPSWLPTGDDAPGLLRALHLCNNGGTVVLDQIYNIKSVLDLTFLNKIDVVISGELHFSTDLKYWEEHDFTLEYRNLSSQWMWGGTDVNIYGGGLINGNGQPWWDAKYQNSSTPRPILFVANGMKGGMIADLHMKDAPDFFNLIENSNDVLISNLRLTAHTINEHHYDNTDGWDIFKSDNIVIQDSYIDNGDDCVSFKANSTNIVVQNLNCNGSHGFSVGSLGEERLAYDIAENILVYNVSMSNASNLVRIKVYPNVTDDDPNYFSGGGNGYVKNIIYDTVESISNQYAISITQCYGPYTQEYCYAHPSKISISDIVIKNMHGTTSGKYGQHVGYIVCNNVENCQNIVAQNISVYPPDGREPQWICDGVDTSKLDINCIPYTDPDEPDNSPGGK